jgi:hypothetical protein
MAKVFRDIDIEWEGEKYVLTPSNRLLRRIEDEVSLTKLFNDAQGGNLSIFSLSYVVCELLKAAGVKNIDEDAVYGELMADVSAGGEIVMQMVEVIAAAMSPPDIADPKKPAAAPQKPKGGKKAANS